MSAMIRINEKISFGMKSRFFDRLFELILSNSKPLTDELTAYLDGINNPNRYLDMTTLTNENMLNFNDVLSDVTKALFAQELDTEVDQEESDIDYFLVTIVLFNAFVSDDSRVKQQSQKSAKITLLQDIVWEASEIYFKMILLHVFIYAKSKHLHKQIFAYVYNKNDRDNIVIDHKTLCGIARGVEKLVLQYKHVIPGVLADDFHEELVTYLIDFHDKLNKFTC